VVRGARATRIAFLVLVVAALCHTVGVQWWRSRQGLGFVAWDFYGFYYPNSIHAWRSIRRGAGLLWNPYQACGQPFFGSITTGVLYPFYMAYWFLPRESAHLLTIALHLLIAAGGTFLLGRSMGLGRIASLTGALAFQLGWTMRQLAAWAPMHLASYSWLPAALWRTEELVHEPSARNAVLLAIVLAVQLLAGFPQVAFFTCQLVVLRVAWAVLVRETSRRPALVAATVGAFVLAPLLVSVQLLPSIEVMQHSIRASSISAEDVGGTFSWSGLWTAASGYAQLPASWVLLPLSAIALATGSRQRRSALFWCVVVAIYLVLSLGRGSLLYTLYEQAPLGTAFRGAGRLLWVVAFALAVAAAIGADAVAARLPRGTAWIVPAIAIAATLLSRLPPLFGQRQGDIYHARSDAFTLVRERATSQDRTLIEGTYPDTTLMPKSATLFEIRDIFDAEEPLTARVYADFYTYLRLGRPRRSLGEWMWAPEGTLSPTLQRPLFDLTGARYLLVDAAADRTTTALPDARLLAERDGVRIYVNPRAMPRAWWAPRAVAVADESDVLPALATGRIDVRRTIVLDRPPESGFLGADGDATGMVTFVADDPERVVLRVRAPARGFLFLADTIYPGWTVRVDGRPAELLRADYTFRAVEVPAGESEVVFAYRPRSLRWGAALSLAGLVAALALGWTRRTPTSRGAR
jgi:hypothetical protein